MCEELQSTERAATGIIENLDILKPMRRAFEIQPFELRYACYDR